MALTRIKTDQVLDGTITNDDLASDIALNTSGDITTSGDISAADISAANVTLTGELNGPATFYIDPAPHDPDTDGATNGLVVIRGDLQVDGTTTTVNSTTMDVADLNITLASGAANAAAADGAGITVDGASATITYDATNDEWDFNKDVHISGELHLTSSAPYIDFFESDTTDVNGRIVSNASRLRFQTVHDDGTNADNRLVIDHVTGDIYFYDTAGDIGMVWDASVGSDGALLVGGHTSLRSGSVGGGNDAQLSLESTNSHYASFIENQNSASGYALFIGKSRGTSAGDVDIVEDGDTAGSVTFIAADGTDLRPKIAEISAVVTPGTTPAVNQISGDLVFSTTNQGQNPTSRMRITNEGNVGIGTDNPSVSSASGSANGLEISGTVPAINLNAGSSDEFLLYGGGSNGNILVGNNNTLRILTGGADRINVDYKGDITAKNTGLDTYVHRKITNATGSGSATRYIVINKTNIGAGFKFVGKIYGSRGTGVGANSWAILNVGFDVNSSGSYPKFGVNYMSGYNANNYTDMTAQWVTIDWDDGNGSATWWALELSSNTGSNWPADLDDMAFQGYIHNVTNNSGELIAISDDIETISNITPLGRGQTTVFNHSHVGIGTTNPGKKLDVNGEARIATGLTITPAISSVYATDSTLSSYATGNGVYLNGHANGWLRLNGSGANRASVDVWGENYAAPYGDSITFRTGGTADRMMIAASGNVGIGNTDPDRPLTITANSGANALALRARSNNDYAFIQFWNNAGNTLRGQIYNYNGSIGFTTSNDSSAGDDLYISSSYGVGINTSTTGGASGRLTVYQDVHGAYTPTSFLDKPTMQLRHANNVNGYTGIRYSNNNGSYEWFTGAHQKTANSADLVTQGYDRQLNGYRENQRIYDTGQIVQPRQPSFMAHKTSHLSIPSSGSVEAGGWSTTHVAGGHNTGGHFNTSTGRFTVPVAGRYKFDANIMHGITSGDFQVWIVVNGNTANAVRSNSMQSTGGNWKQTTVTGLLNLSANDYISIYVRSSTAETYAMYGSNTAAFTSCNGYLLG